MFFDNVILENIYARKSYTPLGEECFCYWEKNADKRAIIQMEGGAVFGTLSIRHVYRREEAQTDAPLIKMSADTVIDRLVLEDVAQSAAQGVTLAPSDIQARVRERIERA